MLQFWDNLSQNLISPPHNASPVWQRPIECFLSYCLHGIKCQNCSVASILGRSVSNFGFSSTPKVLKFSSQCLTYRSVCRGDGDRGSRSVLEPYVFPEGWGIQWHEKSVCIFCVYCPLTSILMIRCSATNPARSTALWYFRYLTQRTLCSAFRLGKMPPCFFNWIYCDMFSISSSPFLIGHSCRKQLDFGVTCYDIQESLVIQLSHGEYIWCQTCILNDFWCEFNDIILS